MEIQSKKTAAKVGAYTTLLGSLCMLIGTAFWGSSGADLDKSLDARDLTTYLASVQEVGTLLITNLSCWIVGVILIGCGATMMTVLSASRPVAAKIALYNYWIAVPLVVASYAAWLAIVARLSADGTPASATLAEVLGWFASRADWIGTILVLGTGPALVASAGREDWVPKWLFFWSRVTLAAGVITVVAMYAGGMTTYGFLIIPVGMGWLIAASVVLFRFR